MTSSEGKARRLYEHCLEHWPEHRSAMWAQRGIVFLDIKAGDYEAAEAGIDTILSDYPDHNDLPKAFKWLGDDVTEDNYCGIVDIFWNGNGCGSVGGTRYSNSTCVQIHEDCHFNIFNDYLDPNSKDWLLGQSSMDDMTIGNRSRGKYAGFELLRTI